MSSHFAISADQTFHMLGVRLMHDTQAYTQQHEQIQLHSCKISQRCTKTTLYDSAQNVLKTFRCSSMHSITHTVPDCNMLPMEADHTYQGCLPFCDLHNKSLTVRQTGKVQSLYIAHANCAISKLHTCVMQSWDSENAQCNLEIAQFPDCAEHKQYQIVSLLRNFSVCV